MYWPFGRGGLYMKNRSVYAIVAMSLALMIGLGGCAAGGQTAATTVQPAGTTAKAASWETIGATEAKKRMDASQGFLLLDVRTPEEFPIPRFLPRRNPRLQRLDNFRCDYLVYVCH